jgi:chromosome segregation ATPase
MKTLEAGVEILQKDKLELTVANEALTAKTDAQERNLNLVNEQITSLNDRNSTLSRKCVEILESGKETKEKSIDSDNLMSTPFPIFRVANYERELENLRPHCESLQQQLNSLTEENK